MNVPTSPPRRHAPKDAAGEAYTANAARDHATPLRLTDSATLVFTPDTEFRRDRPCVTLGAFADGRVAIHFRKYAVVGGLLVPRSDGISLTVEEFDLVSRRMRSLLERPEATTCAA